MKVEVIAIEQHDGHMAGDRYFVGAWTASELVDKRLVKMAAAHPNKMREPPENKANPTRAAGMALKSSALPAAQVLHTPMQPPRKRGRPPKSAAK
jgi:hypothetical protein